MNNIYRCVYFPIVEVSINIIEMILIGWKCAGTDGSTDSDHVHG